MLNKSTSRSEYVVQSIETPYPIGFAFQHNGDGTPQIRVTIGDMVAKENEHFVISEDSLSIKLLSLGENDKWVGAALVIERDIPFVQESDYQVGRISPEQIEKDFDLSVMRDQMLGEQIKGCTDGMQVEIDALHSRVDFVQEEHASDMAAVDAVMATKATKTELQNAKTTLSAGLQENAQAIQETRDDMNAKDSQLETTLSSHTGELATLRDQVSGVEEKIPESVSDSNPLVTKEDLANIDLDDFVKKSGDTMTGDLVMSSDKFNTKAKLTTQGAAGRTTLRVSAVDAEDKNVYTSFEFERSGALVVRHAGISGENMGSLGTKNVPMRFVYAKRLNSADGDSQLGDRERDLIIPSVGGTIARVEDINAIGGDGTAGQVLTKTDEGMAWQDASGGGDYLPLTGGTLEPAAAIGFVGYTGGQVRKLSVSSLNVLEAPDGFQCGKLYPKVPKYTDIGDSIYSWRAIYVTKINNGADLDVPTEGGTLARIEDIDAVVGDISTALTAILGE